MTSMGLWGQLSDLSVEVWLAERTGKLSRLKACANPGCRWLFWDPRAPGPAAGARCRSAAASRRPATPALESGRRPDAEHYTPRTRRDDARDRLVYRRPGLGCVAGAPFRRRPSGRCSRLAAGVRCARPAGLLQPRLRGRTREEWATIGALGAAIATMNVAFYQAVDRLPSASLRRCSTWDHSWLPPRAPRSAGASSSPSPP